LIVETTGNVLYYGAGRVIGFCRGELVQSMLGGDWQYSEEPQISITHFTYGSVWKFYDMLVPYMGDLKIFLGCDMYVYTSWQPGVEIDTTVRFKGDTETGCDTT
jgi:hypothetical protein